MALKTDEISFSIETVANKAISTLTKLADKYSTLDKAIRPVANALQKTNESTSSTINKFKNLSNTVEKTSNDFKSKLKEALNLNPKVDTSEYENKLNALMEKHRKLSTLVNAFNESYERYRYAEPGSEQAKLYEDVVSKRTISDVPEFSMNIGDAEKQLDSYKMQMNDLKQTIANINGVGVKPDLSEVIRNTDDAKRALILLNAELEKSKGTGSYAGINNAMKTIEKQFGVSRKEALATDDNLKKVEKTAKRTGNNLLKMALAMASNRKHAGGLGNVFNGFGKKLGNTLEDGTRRLKKFALGLLAVRTTMSLLTRSVNAYLSFDKQLQDSVNNSWNMLGALLGPAIEYVADMFAKATAYIYSFIKMLTGIDLVARANAKALNSQAAATGGAAKAAQKALAPFDELFNISQENSSGGGGGSDLDLIEVPEIKTTKIFDDIMKAIKEGDWYKVGYLVADKLADAMESIPWKKIQDKANKIGKNIADFINGAAANKRFWIDLGDTIAQGVNTAISFVSGLNTINGSELGDSVGKAISTAIRNIDWKNFFQNIYDAIKNLVDFLGSLLTDEDGKWTYAQDSILDGLFGADPSQMIRSITRFLGRLIPQFIVLAIKMITGIQLIEIINQYLIAPAFENMKLGGGHIIQGLLEGIKSALLSIGTWIVENIFKPFMDGFRRAFGIHSPSTVMMEMGRNLIDGLKQGIGNIWDKVRTRFDELKTNIKTKLENIKTDVYTKAGDIGTNIVTGIGNGLRTLKSKVEVPIRHAINGIVSLLNRMINGINSRLSITISGGIGKLIKKITGINISGTYQLFSIPNVPALETGTNRIEEEGIYHLHEDEAVVPKKYNPALGVGFDNNSKAVEETNDLLRALIDVVESKNYEPKIGVDDVGRASVDYIRKQRRITGGSVI